MSLDYQVFFTMLERKNEYGTKTDVSLDVDISDLVLMGGISNIIREIDQGNYEIGIFNYGDVQLTCYNNDGKFNERDLDSRSIFPWRRDKTIVEISYINESGTTTQVFKGIIADRATRDDSATGKITFKVLSLDSIFGQEQIPTGAIKTGDNFSKAFEVILNTSFIDTLLNYNVANINPALDLIIDDGSKFDKLITKTALDELLQASNSILLIDSSDNIIVRSRTENANSPHQFFSNDRNKQDNIRMISERNTGLQRMFNSVLVNDFESKNQSSIDDFDVRQIKFSLDFITTEPNEQAIADSILSDFGTPKEEFWLTTDTETAKVINFLDKCSVSMDLLLKAEPGFNVGMYDIDQYEVSKYPVQIGSMFIDGRRIFKVIGFRHDPENYVTALKLRDTGVLAI